MDFGVSINRGLMEEDFCNFLIHTAATKKLLTDENKDKSSACSYKMIADKLFADYIKQEVLDHIPKPGPSHIIHNDVVIACCIPGQEFNICKDGKRKKRFRSGCVAYTVTHNIILYLSDTFDGGQTFYIDNTGDQKVVKVLYDINYGLAVVQGCKDLEYGHMPISKGVKYMILSSFGLLELIN